MLAWPMRGLLWCKRLWSWGPRWRSTQSRVRASSSRVKDRYKRLLLYKNKIRIMVHGLTFRTYPHFSGSPINLLPWLSRQDQTFSALVSSIIPRQVRNIFPTFYCVAEQISNPSNDFLQRIWWWMFHGIVSLDLCLRKHSRPVWPWTICKAPSPQIMSTWSCSR